MGQQLVLVDPGAYDRAFLFCFLSPSLSHSPPREMMLFFLLPIIY